MSLGDCGDPRFPPYSVRGTLLESYWLGCVLSPLLFILDTDDCRTSHPNRHLVKFTDDTVLLPLLSGPAQDHGPALDEFMEWCDTSCLELNVTKTEEMVVFSSRQQESRVSPFMALVQRVLSGPLSPAEILV
ncbi:hypothetical protein AAFF_G00440320 [Aldrovandia affinis]|uniref:Reverse transcriptase domain-containing protein n=1 Tax=Aldrovandia affinis TaxID=143900 RepID=A0AAD7WHP9_9TELE|nr:hypothetical protein AAFF_G00440320 [Aldrovandia affinis]